MTQTKEVLFVCFERVSRQANFFFAYLMINIRRSDRSNREEKTMRVPAYGILLLMQATR